MSERWAPIKSSVLECGSICMCTRCVFIRISFKFPSKSVLHGFERIFVCSRVRFHSLPFQVFCCSRIFCIPLYSISIRFYVINTLGKVTRRLLIATVPVCDFEICSHCSLVLALEWNTMFLVSSFILTNTYKLIYMLSNYFLVVVVVLFSLFCFLGFVCVCLTVSIQILSKKQKQLPGWSCQ